MAIKLPIPQVIKLLEPGLNDTLTGPMIYDTTLLDELNAQFKKQGKIAVDRNHLLTKSELGETTTDELDAKIAYGWIELRAQADGIYAINCEWTQKGEELISSGEFRKFSVEAYLTKENTVVGLKRISLTNSPADLLADLHRKENILIDIKDTKMDDNTVMSKMLQLKEDEEDKKDKSDETDEVDEKVEKEDETDDQAAEDAKFDELTEKVAALEALVEELNNRIDELTSEKVAVEKEAEKIERNNILSQLKLNDKVKASLSKLSLNELKNKTRHLVKSTTPAPKAKIVVVETIQPVEKKEYKPFSMSQLLVEK